MQYRRGEDGGENAIESQAEAGEGTIAIADTEGARRAYGMSSGPHRKALCHRAVYVRPAHYAESDDSTKYAYADYYGSSE